MTVVSYVMNENRYVDREKRERVLRAAKELNYTPSNVARALRGKPSNQILFVVDNPANERLSWLMRGMDQYAYERQSMVTLCATRNEPEFVRQVIRRRFDGIVISSMSLAEEYVQEFIDAGVPTVLLLTHDYKSVTGAAKIGTGLYRGMRDAVQHLYDRGCRSMVYLDRTSVRGHFSDLTDCRLRGFADSMEALGLPWEDRIITGCTSEDEVQAKLADAVERFHIDAVAGRNDRMASIGMYQLARMGLRVPEDVCVIGFDNSSICSYVTPSLTSVQLDDDGICRAAIEEIYQLRSGGELPPVRHFDHRIVQRGSTAR